MKTEVIQVRVSPELKKKLQKMADKDDRKLGDFIRVQLKQFADPKK